MLSSSRLCRTTKCVIRDCSFNMEDKGMEENRAKEFQRTIVNYLKEIGNTEYQLIYATSMCADEYDNEQYAVGEKYSEGNKSLKNI